MILQKIIEGTYPAGSRLPSEAQLELEHRVSRITIRRALKDLAAAGHIVRQPGLGTFVLERRVIHRPGKLDALSADLIDQGFEVRIQVLEHGRARCPTDVTGRLGWNSKQVALFDQRLLYVDEAPFVLGASYFLVPADFSIGSESLNRGFLLSTLQESKVFPIHRIRRTMEATTCTENEARILGVSTNVPMLASELLIFDAENQCIGISRLLYRGDRYKHAQEFQF